jgi:hypothetical protein
VAESPCPNCRARVRPQRHTGTYEVVCPCGKLTTWPDAETEARCACGRLLAVPAWASTNAAEPFRVAGMGRGDYRDGHGTD